ncbi:MAG: hypothetical protein V3U20_06965 [Thermoplasmata archaeon]
MAPIRWKIASHPFCPKLKPEKISGVTLKPLGNDYWYTALSFQSAYDFAPYNQCER